MCCDEATRAGEADCSDFDSELLSYRAAVLHYAVSEAAVALGSDLHVVGALQQNGLLQVAR
ncbi:hypothetical protein EYF80_007566 [Liparis tanakae]|uniref:Uncharacterized protein n=1 Tax=Liparis tanakae TaxID=230148 RepID=A0A4Z2IXG8_9TELE|nr:hypothetical protein EYF80_007566 [Liparis tanakae]